MFLINRRVPLIAQKCEALIRNLPPDYPKLKEINSELATSMSGYYGEKSLDYHLGSLNQEKFDIYPGLRLPIQNQYFQIDNVIISKSFLLIVEVKYLKGELEFDSAKGQLIQMVNGTIKVYDDPFAQVKKQRIQLLQWLDEQRFPPIPIDTLVVLANNNALIKKITGASENYWKLARCINALEKIAIFEKMYRTDCITIKDMKKLGKLFIKKDSPLDKDINKRFNIIEDVIQPGLSCPKCLARPMKHVYGAWYCPACDSKSKTAHIPLLRDYFLINGNSITNKQFREITLLNDRKVASRILNSMNLQHQGTNRGRIYFPPKTDELSVLPKPKKRRSQSNQNSIKEETKKPEAQLSPRLE